MKNKILIFTDLDGSLLNTKNFKFEKAKSLIKKIIKLFSVGFVYATVITGILYYLIKYIAS